MSNVDDLTSSDRTRSAIFIRKIAMVKTSQPPHGEMSALLVIDVQRGLFKQASPVYEAEALLENINSLVDRAHKKDVSVFYIQHANDSSLVKGTENWKLHPDMQPTDTDEVIQKRQGSAFVDTSLGEGLASRRVGKLAITGLVSQGCVRATCLDALQLGYTVELVEDAHSTYSKTAKRIIRKWNKKLGEQGATLVKAAEVLFE
jgi:nicotinamidase-related amidase